MELAREVVSASTTPETGELHFKANYISEVIDTTFRIWYNGVDVEYAVTATSGRNAVWSDYTFVLHLNDATATATDSSGNTDFIYGGDTFGTSGSLPMGGIAFDGTDDQLEANTAVFAGDQDPLTYQMWLNADSFFGNNSSVSLIGEQQNGDSSDNRNAWEINDVTDTPQYGSFPNNGGTSGTASSSSLSLNTTYMLHMTKDTDILRHYKNGEIIGSPIVHTTEYTGGAALTTWIGNRNEDCCDQSFDGDIDEVRARTTELSAAWIRAEYTNQSTTTDFYFLSTGTGSTTIANHDDTQVPNAFNFQNKTNEPLFAFKQPK